MKKILFGLLCILILGVVLCVYIIGGSLGAYAWNIAIFIFAPLACFGLMIEFIILIVRLCKKKKYKWNLLFLGVTFLLALPITILFGVANITYPTTQSADYGITGIMPIENGVVFGGKDYKTHAIWPSECYAYDILAEPYDVGSRHLSDYGIYKADVIAPVAGMVIGIENGEENIPPNTETFQSALGNYIFMEMKETKTYLILAHLEKDSILVAVGDRVNPGDIIGKVGNSGTTSEPHLHIQHQKQNSNHMTFPSCAQGLPLSLQ